MSKTVEKEQLLQHRSLMMRCITLISTGTLIILSIVLFFQSLRSAGLWPWFALSTFSSLISWLLLNKAYDDEIDISIATENRVKEVLLRKYDLSLSDEQKIYEFVEIDNKIEMVLVSTLMKGSVRGSIVYVALKLSADGTDVFAYSYGEELPKV